MNHLSDIELLEYLDGENPGAEAHVRGCAQCQSNLAVFTRLNERASDSALERTSGQFTSLIMAEVLKPEVHSPKVKIPRFTGIAVLLAAACVIIVIALNSPAATSISNMKLDITGRALSFDYSNLKTNTMLQDLNGFFKNPVVTMMSLAVIVMSALAGLDRMFMQRMRKF